MNPSKRSLPRVWLKTKMAQTGTLKRMLGTAQSVLESEKETKATLVRRVCRMSGTILTTTTITAAT
jgi:hypothetical protein